MTEYYSRLQRQLSSLERRVSGMFKQGTVEEVKGNRIRMNFGKNNGGEDVLGPWLDTGNHRGGSRERRFYKKGQNIMMCCPNGDPAMGFIVPWAPNEKFKQPDNANESGENEETYQQDTVYNKTTPDAQEFWLAPESQEQQQDQASGTGGLGGGQQQQKQKPDPDKDALVLVRAGEIQKTDTDEEEVKLPNGGGTKKQRKKYEAKPKGRYHVRVKKGKDASVSEDKPEDGEILYEASDRIRFKVGNASIILKSDEIELKLGQSIVVVKEDGVYTVNSTYLGVDQKGEKPPNKVKDISDNPAKQTFTKVL